MDEAVVDSPVFQTHGECLFWSEAFDDETQILAITEVVKLIRDWKSRGAWIVSTNGPLVEIKALDIPLWKLLGSPSGI